MTGATALAALILLGSVALAEAVTLTVQADPRKWNGQPWDGLETFAPVNLPTTTPPDLAVCVVRVGQPEVCFERHSGGQRLSLCQDSSSCTFALTGVDTRHPFGLFIYDIDMARDDLVDIAIMVPTAATPAATYQPIETALRRMMETRTPAITPMERNRRERASQVLTVEQCREGCRLVQSGITMR